MFILIIASVWTWLCSTCPCSPCAQPNTWACEVVETHELLSPEMSHETNSGCYMFLGKCFTTSSDVQWLEEVIKSAAEEQRYKESVQQMWDSKSCQINMLIKGLLWVLENAHQGIAYLNNLLLGSGLKSLLWLALLG